MKKIIILIFLTFSSYAHCQTDETLPPPTSVTSNDTLNGLNVKTLNDIRNKLQKDQNAGQVTFFTNTKWQDGMRSVTNFEGYKIYGNKQHEGTRDFALQGDEPEEISGTDRAPSGVEQLMFAAGTSITATANAKAVLSGVKLTKFEVHIESSVDLRGILAIDPEVRPAIITWKTKIFIAGDADKEILKKIAAWGYDYSPVSNTVRRGVSMVSPLTIIAENIQFPK